MNNYKMLSRIVLAVVCMTAVTGYPKLCYETTNNLLHEIISYVHPRALRAVPFYAQV